ncbi:hypothetical protein L494_4317 [Bordetella bronchiseptica CA90 BB1334]|nr:hypothetical protein L494_4317 [Bordetella bronchiseptica CA90 BB1334]
MIPRCGRRLPAGANRALGPGFFLPRLRSAACLSCPDARGAGPRRDGRPVRHGHQAVRFQTATNHNKFDMNRPRVR